MAGDRLADTTQATAKRSGPWQALQHFRYLQVNAEQGSVEARKIGGTSWLADGGGHGLDPLGVLGDG